MERLKVYQVLDGERDYQDDRWQKDIAARKSKYTEYEWLLFIQDYLTEAIRLATRGNEVDDARIAVQNSIRKITAMGVACMEQNGCPEREGYERVIVPDHVIDYWCTTFHPRTMKFVIPVGDIPDNEIDAYVAKIAAKYKKNVTLTTDGFDIIYPDGFMFHPEKHKE
jgi:hypothetical protein